MAQVKKISNGVNTVNRLIPNREPLETMILGNTNHSHNKLIMGGAVKNAGWDPRHPRLSRNPNWYEGRGEHRAENVGKVIEKVVSIGAKIAPLVAGGAIKNAGWDPRHPRLSRNPNWYEGRGEHRAENFGKGLEKVVSIGAKLAPLLA